RWCCRERDDCIALPANRFCIGPGAAGRGYRCPHCWQVMNDRLKSVHRRIDARRQQLQEALARNSESQKLLTSWTTFVDTLLADMYGEQTVAKPCRFAFCVCGSLARTEACPWSDIDAFILTEHQS